MAQEVMDVCLRGLKETTKVGSTATVSILPFGIVACTVFATTFLEIAVYISLTQQPFSHRLVAYI